MPRLKLSVANAGGHFSSEHINIIRRAVRSAERYVAALFPLDYDIDLIVTAPSYLMPIIPEDGLSGRTYNSRLIMLVIDTTKLVREDFVFETVCHELSHSLRWEKLPEHADTLLKAVLFEGLATVFEEAALAATDHSTAQFFLTDVRATSPEIVQSIRSQLAPSYDDEAYNYGTIFYDGNESLPRWSAYRLGYNLVQEYLKQNNTDIAAVMMLRYDELTANTTVRR